MHVWNKNSIEKLQTAFEITDWQLLNSGEDINECTDIINSYVSFCESIHIETKTVTSDPNNKPWVTRELKQIIRGKRQAFARGDFGKVKELNHKLKQEIKGAKERYRGQT